MHHHAARHRHQVRLSAYRRDAGAVRPRFVHHRREAVYGRGGGSGIASWYGGRRTPGAGRFTAAHRSYPFGTRVLVTSKATGRSVVVQINDRGPFIRGRVIDLSRPAARAVGISGVGRVSLRRL